MTGTNKKLLNSGNRARAKAWSASSKNMPNISLRLPVEVLDYFKTRYPKGYTSKMAEVLAAYVEAKRSGKE